MMLQIDLNVFPFNVTTHLGFALEQIDPGTAMLKRPLRGSDPDQSIAVFASTWAPVAQSAEIGRSEPTVQQYSIGVQGMIKHADKDMGLALSTMLSKLIRSTLYRSRPLHLALGQLVVDDGFSKERFARMTLRNQQFMSMDIKNTFSTLSVLDVVIETETS
jgi:hypothetical protein